MNGKSLKSELRKEVQHKLRQLTQAEREARSKQIVAQLCEHPQYNEAKVVFAYLPFREEVMIGSWIEHAWTIGKKVFVPRVNSMTREMKFYEMNGWEDVEIGTYGIREPKESCKEYDGSAIDLMIVPGVVFDLHKYRIGYGAGYYDRFFAQMNNLPYRISVAFDVQVVQKLPIDSWDVPVDEIITESRTIR